MDFPTFCLALKTELVRVKKLMEEKRKKEKAIYSKLFTSWRAIKYRILQSRFITESGRKQVLVGPLISNQYVKASWKWSLWKLLCNKPYIENKKHVTICQKKTCRLLLQWILYFSENYLCSFGEISDAYFNLGLQWNLEMFWELEIIVKNLVKVETPFRVGRNHIFTSGHITGPLHAKSEFVPLCRRCLSSQ